MSETSGFDLVRMDYGGRPALFVYGEIDVLSAPRLHAVLEEMIAEEPSTILVDLANVAFLDSTGLSTLLVAHRHLEERGGALRLVSVPTKLLQVIEVAGLAERFHVDPDMEAATGGPDAT